LVVQRWVQTSALVSQRALWQSALAAQVPQSGAPVGAVPQEHCRPKPPVTQAEPPQSAGLLQVPVVEVQKLFTQKPLWHWLPWVQAEQATNSAGGAQVHWRLVGSHAVPLGQSVSRTQAAVHLPIEVSQLPLRQSALLAQASQVAPGQAQVPPEQALPPHCELAVQVWMHLPLVQTLLAQSLFCAQAPQAARPVLVQSQKSAPPSGLLGQAWPPH
jgi:hypothetical protein